MNEDWIGISVGETKSEMDDDISPLFPADPASEPVMLKMEEPCRLWFCLITDSGSLKKYLGDIVLVDPTDLHIQVDSRNNLIVEDEQRHKWRFSLKDLDSSASSGSHVNREHPASMPVQVVDRKKLRAIEEKQKEERRASVKPDEIYSLLSREIFGQDEAVRIISEKIAGSLLRTEPELLVIALLGHTGVGKTALGKALPGVLQEVTNKVYGFQQIAMNEFEGASSTRFFGASASYVGYGETTIFEPVRENPYQVFVLDEIEKAKSSICTALMQVFDESKVRLADNSPEIDLSHCIFILTSNIPVDMKAYNTASSFKKKEICRSAFVNFNGRPEVVSRISALIAMQDLSDDAKTDLIVKFANDELHRYGMQAAHIDETLIAELKTRLSDDQFGARAVKSEVRDAIESNLLYRDDIDQLRGKSVNIEGSLEHIRIETNECYHRQPVPPQTAAVIRN